MGAALGMMTREFDGMHILPGALSPPTYAAALAVMTPLWLIAGRVVTRRLRARQVPLLAVGAAFSFVVMFLDVPNPLGSGTGHPVGAALLAVLLGPWAATLSLTVVLAVQAFLFHDGGILELGANCFNMAVLGAFGGYAVYRLVAAGARVSRKRQVIAAGLAGYVSINLMALGTAVMLGLQPALAHTPHGVPLYFLYGLKVTLTALLLPHLLLFGFLEAAVTAVAFSYLARTRPDLVAPVEATRAA